MRELTKSMFSWTWAMSIFGMQQMTDMASGMMGSPDRAGKAARGFDNVVAAATGEMGQTMRTAFDTGNNMQRSMVDMIFGGLAMMDPQRLSKMAASAAGRQPGGCPPSQPGGGGRPNPFAQNRPADGGMPTPSA